MSNAESGSASSSSPGQGGAASGGGGLTGSSGSDGASDSGGAAGGTPASGAAGQAGGADGDMDCARRDGGDIQLWLHQDITNTQDNEIHPAFLLTRTGLSVPLKELTIRYYFSAEGAGDWELTCLWVTKAGDADHGLCDEGVSMKVVALDPPRTQADQYLEISFAGVASATLSEGLPIEARVMFWRAGHPILNLANDYSFTPNLEPVMNEGTRSYRQTSRVTVYRNGALVWGEEPCP
jgi:hypothetical protein